MNRWLVIFLFVYASNSFAFSTPIQNVDELLSETKIADVLQNRARVVKVAILDRGFRNFELEVGSSLPISTSFHAGPVVLSETQQIAHGTLMAQLVSALLEQGSSSQLKYEIHLYSANDTNLSSAVSDIIQRHVDVALYAIEPKFKSSNESFVASEVTKATQAGVVWISSADVFSNSNAISVASSSSSIAADVKLEGSVQVENSGRSDTDENAAAIFASVAAAYRANSANLSRDEVIQKWTGEAPQPPPSPVRPPVPPAPRPPQPAPPPPQSRNEGRGLPLFVLGFKPTLGDCFERTVISSPPASLVQLLRDGAIPVRTSKGIKVFVDVDPMTIIFGVQRYNPADMIVATAQGFFVYSRAADGQLPFNSYEVVQVPKDQYVCN